MADVFGTDDLGVEDASPLKTGDMRRSYNSCIAKHMSKGKTKAEATALCKK